jgi:hypothetical protein
MPNNYDGYYIVILSNDALEYLVNDYRLSAAYCILKNQQ